MAAAVRRRTGPPPPHSPPPLKIRPQCGGTVVTFEDASLGFSIIDVNGVPVVSEAPLAAGFEVGDRLVCVNGARLPRLPSWKVKALFESCGRPVAIEFTKGPIKEGFELDDVTRPLAHVEVSRMLHDATRLQPPFCMHLARSLVEAYEKGGDVSLDEALSPTIKAFCEVLFADAPVQAVAPMPPPWALAATKAAKNFLQREDVDEGTFNALSLTLAAALPNHLTTPAKGWTGNQKVEDVLRDLGFDQSAIPKDDDCIFKRENEKMARATAQLQAVMKARKKLLLGRDRARAKKAIADAQMDDPNCIFGREVRRAEKAAHVVQRALKRATSSENVKPPLPPRPKKRTVRTVAPPAWLRAGINVECDWRGRGAWYRGTVIEVRGRVCSVRYNDGGSENNVPFDRVRQLETSSAVERRPAPRKISTTAAAAPPVEAPDEEDSSDEEPTLTLDLAGKWYSVDAQTGKPNGDRYEFKQTSHNEYVTYRNGRETPKSQFTIVQEHNHLKGKMRDKIHGPRGRTYAPSFKVRDTGDLHWDIQDSKWLSRRDCGVECLLEVRRSAGGSLRIAAGSVVAFKNYGDGYSAIVNAANVMGLGGGGVDAAVNSAGGANMHKDRRALPVINNRNERIQVGGCAATGPNQYGNINTEFVLHAVGPDFRSHPAQQAETLLLSAYSSALNVAKEKGIKRVAFPLLSAGIFRGHVALDRVVELACRAVAMHEYQGDVYLCGFLPAEQVALKKGVDARLKEGLVLPLDCVHQRAARAEKEAQRAYKLRRRAEELAQRENRRDAFRQAGSTMVRAMREAHREEAQQHLARTQEGTASFFQRREAERQRTQRRTEQIAAREREKLKEKEAAAAALLSRKTAATSVFNQRREEQRREADKRREEELRKLQEAQAQKEREAEALLQRKLREKRELEERRAREREEAEARRAEEIARLAEVQERKAREARELKERKEREKRELLERREAEARAVEAQREAERKAIEDRRAAEAAAIQRRKAEEERAEAKKVANRKAIEAARKAVSGFHKGDARFSHRGPQGWEGYSHQHCQVIERAMKASNGSGKVALPGIPFEVRWGDEAVSAKLPHPPPEGIIQVNVRSQNTRVVRRDGASSQPSPQPTPWQQDAPSLPSPQPTSWLQEAPAPPPAPQAPVGLWQWESGPDAWAPMDTAACRQLDQARASGERTVVLSHLPGGPCRVDLAQMVQTNVRTGTTRRIRRGAGGASAPPQPPRPPPRQPGSTLMRVKIPPNMPPGGSITVRAPDGRLVRVRVPQGVAPGATITVRI